MNIDAEDKKTAEAVRWYRRGVSWLIRQTILKKFFDIKLTSDERKTADTALDGKYAAASSAALFYSILLIPALLILDTQVVVSVLIPTTMVAGTAWFAVSLASMKKKFEAFGMELTTDLFVAFALSLIMLFLATATSLTRGLWGGFLAPYAAHPWAQATAGILALVSVGKLLFSIFSGSIKYDINDAMLTGQNEVAERFFKQSLSLLHATSESLRNSRSLQVANYSIGVAFYEVFSTIRKLALPVDDARLKDLLERCNLLIRTPSMPQQEADNLARDLAREFVALCNSPSQALAQHKSFIAVKDEIRCLTENTGEQQHMIDTRMSVVFDEISNLIEEFGQGLFGSSSN